MRVNPIQQLALDNSRLVQKCLKNFRIPALLDYEDLEQAGWEGLMYAAQHYDSTYGTSFSTYAIPCIRGSIMRCVYRNLSVFHIPLKDIDREGIQGITEKLRDFNKQVVEISDNFDIPFDNSESIDEKIDLHFFLRLIKSFKHVLTPNRRKAIDLYFFSKSDENRLSTLQEVSDMMGVSRERVRQLIKYGLQKVKKEIGTKLDVYI